jgi:transposase
MAEKRRNYDDEFKRAAIRLVTVNGHGVSETARHRGINANRLSRWKREDETQHSAALAGNGRPSEEQDERRQLRHEVKRLRMEREVKKKALRATLRACRIEVCLYRQASGKLAGIGAR